MLSRARRSFAMSTGLAVALALAPMVARASGDKAPASKPVEAKAVETKGHEAKTEETRPATPAKDAKPTDAKAKPAEVKGAEAKPGEAKSGEAKAEAKAGDAKTDAKAKAGEAKADAKEKDAKVGGDKGAAEGEGAEKPVKPARKKKASAPKEPTLPPGEGPSPASPPPLNMGGLRDEVRREGAVSKIDPGASPRTKVEQMLAEVVKTREALRSETVRLEGMMAAEQPEAAGAAGGAAPAGAAGAAKPAKNPLDILAKALRGIKPEQAAPIVSRLDKRLAATVLQRMPPIDAGKIMGAMKPDTAAELATQIALRAPEAKK